MAIVSRRRTPSLLSVVLCCAVVLVFSATPCTRLQAQAPLARWTLTPELRIGNDTSGPSYQFSRIGTIAATDSGVYVLMGQEQEIRQFDMRGKFVRTIGHKGQGPGEFAGVSAFGFLGDTLYVVDGTQRRTSFFGRDGMLLSTMTWQARGTPAPGTPIMSVVPGPLMRDGTGFASVGLSSGAAAAPILRVARTGAVTDTLAWQATQHGGLQVTGGPGGNSFNGSQPFRDGTLSALVPALGRVVLVDRTAATSSRSASFRVITIGLKHDTIYSRAYPYTPVAINAKTTDSVVKGLVQQGARAGLTDKDIRAALYLPGYFTPIARVVAAPDGTVWLNRADARATQDWMIIAPNGNLAASLTLPPRTQLLLVAGNAVWCAEMNVDDVPTLVRYRLNRG